MVEKVKRLIRQEDIGGIRLPPEKEWAKNVYWMYSILIEDEFGMSQGKHL